MKRIVAGGFTAAVFCLTAPAAAQFYIPPQCDIDTKHFLVKQAQIYVKAASEAKKPEDRQEALTDAFGVLKDAVERGEVENPGVWYFFGRAYTLEGDYHGADSAFTKVESLMPACATDTDTYRKQLWVPEYNAAVAALRENDWATAKPHLANANVIYHMEPFVPFYLGSIYAQDGEQDEAIEEFRTTIEMLVDGPRDSLREAGQDPAAMDYTQLITSARPFVDSIYDDSYETAVYNMARLFHQKSAWDSAIVWYRTYLGLKPDDISALQSLALILDVNGQSEEAVPIYQEMLSRSDDLTDQQLFQTGVTLFQGEHYEIAATAFRKGLDKNPYFRDGWYNLGQCYFALASPPNDDSTEVTPEEKTARTEWAVKMLDVGHELRKIDPINTASLQLLAQAYQLTGEEDSLISVMNVYDGMSFDVNITFFEQTDTGVHVTGTLTNLKDEDTPVPEITFTFVNAAGETVTTETVAAQTLGSFATADFDLNPVGEGIVGWTYQAASSGT